MESFIYIEPSEDGIDSLTKQIAVRIREISPELRGPIKGIAIGNHLDNNESQLAGLVDELIIVETPPENECNSEVITNILSDFIKDNSPSTLFLGFTHQGMELGPAVGWRVGVPVITGCISFDWNEEEAYAKRTIFEGKFFTTCSVNMERGAVISVQKGAWKDKISTKSSEEVVLTRIPWKESWAAEKTEVVAIEQENLQDKEDIAKAEILLSVGRGLGGAENLQNVEELKDLLGGMISCSRPVVDLSWLPSYRQVGISGKTVTPLIYLALGISGQNNHIAGMDGSETIIAVNKDPMAPIFSIADYGVVDDMHDFVPELIKQIKTQKTS